MREKFSKEFKVQAVELVIKEGFSVKAVSTNIGVHPNNLYRWISEFEKYGDLAFPGKGSHDFIYQNKLKQLETENEQLKNELELLKKFRAFLKKNQ